MTTSKDSMSAETEISWCSHHHNVATLEIEGPCWEQRKLCTLCEREQLRAEVERLKEVATIPLITPEAPPGLYMRVLTEHEKGQPVNVQDLINALMWRVKNQREQLARLNRRVEEYRTDDDE